MVAIEMKDATRHEQDGKGALGGGWQWGLGFKISHTCCLLTFGPRQYFIHFTRS